MQLIVLLTLVGSAAVSAQDIGAIKACVDQQISESTAKFAGSAGCPVQCARCHAQTPGECPQECRSKNTFCGCSNVIFQAINDARVCCSRQQGLLAVACSFGLDEVQGVCQAMAGSMCNGVTAMDAETPPSLSQIIGGALEKAVPGRLASLLEGGSESATTYVQGHSKGAACVSLLESMERDQAEQAQSEEMPDLHAVASQIAEGSSGILGRAMPELKDKVHRAMVSAWTEEGPGMDADKICEVVLRHHDSL